MSGGMLGKTTQTLELDAGWGSDPLEGEILGRSLLRRSKGELRSLVASPVATWERCHSALLFSAAWERMGCALSQKWLPCRAGQQKQWGMEMPSESSLFSLLGSTLHLAKAAFPSSYLLVTFHFHLPAFHTAVCRRKSRCGAPKECSASPSLVVP